MVLAKAGKPNRQQRLCPVQEPNLSELRGESPEAQRRARQQPEAERTGFCFRVWVSQLLDPTLLPGIFGRGREDPLPRG